MCFECSTLPEHKGTRTLVIRILDILKPIACVIPDYDGWVPIPKKGELLKVGQHKVWSRDVDNPAAYMRSLALLWPKAV